MLGYQNPLSQAVMWAVSITTFFQDTVTWIGEFVNYGKGLKWGHITEENVVEIKLISHN